MSRKLKDNILKALIWGSTIITIGILLWILGFIFVKGYKLVDWQFITSNYNDKTSYLIVEKVDTPSKYETNTLNNKIYYDKDYEKLISDPLYIENLGIAILKVDYRNRAEHEERIIVAYIEDNSPVLSAIDKRNIKIPIKKGNIIRKINGVDISGLSLEEISKLINEAAEKLEMKITKPGYGIFSNIIMTLYMIIISLSIAVPIGILSAIYLVEYAKPGRLVNLIRFATESLAGIPSIIYGLFGMAFFVVFLKFNLSLLSGALTVSIILLPIIIRSTEEAIKAVPMSYREGSYGLGATKLQTIRKIIIPSAMPGILVSVILSIGRIVGESAALILTAGTVAKIPDSLFSSGSTLTVQAYYVAKEEANIEMACAIGVVIITLIIILNIISKYISKKLNKANY